MPNWVKNIIDCEGDTLSNMYKKNEQGITEFDFNVVLPMPKELEDNNWQYPDTRTSEQIKALKEKYGASDWYHWRIHNWGTKWNGGEVYDKSDSHAEIDTAWATPEPVIKAISKQFNTYIHVSYADEDLGSNCGEYTYKNGELTYRRKFVDKNGNPDHKAMFDFACNVWGLDPEEERRRMEEWENE